MEKYQIKIMYNTREICKRTKKKNNSWSVQIHCKRFERAWDSAESRINYMNKVQAALINVFVE